MDVDEVITLGAGIVALAGAAFAMVQAWSAKDSADSARRQADAAEQQIIEMRRQFDAEMSARDEAFGPTFMAEKAEIFTRGEYYVEAILVMTAGPPLASVTARVRGDNVRGLVHHAGDYNKIPHLEFSHIASGAKLGITAEMQWDTAAPANLTVDLDCLEEGGHQRRWRRSCTASANDRPEPPSYLARRRSR